MEKLLISVIIDYLNWIAMFKENKTLSNFKICNMFWGYAGMKQENIKSVRWFQAFQYG